VICEFNFQDNAVQRSSSPDGEGACALLDGAQWECTLVWISDYLDYAALYGLEVDRKVHAFSLSSLQSFSVCLKKDMIVSAA
jgi:hypothetical protein